MGEIKPGFDKLPNIKEITDAIKKGTNNPTSLLKALNMFRLLRNPINPTEPTSSSGDIKNEN